MAMSGNKKRFNGMSVGIKELKDRASEIVATVERTGRAISITKNNREVARIMSISSDPHEQLVAAGLLRPGPKPRQLAGLKVERTPSDASPAIDAILRDREEVSDVPDATRKGN